MKEHQNAASAHQGMNIIFFLGPPGSGKGTQARLLTKVCGASLLGMGDLLRQEVQEKTALGQKIKPVLEEGALPSWKHFVREVFEKQLDALKSSWVIFDGVPRTEEQMMDVESMIASRKARILSVFFLEVPDEILIHRLVGRYQCASCGASYMRNIEESDFQDVPCANCGSQKFSQRPDDQEEVIRKRLRLYNETMGPLVTHYQKKGLLKKVDGILPISEIQALIFNDLKEKSASFPSIS
jgi:adenylate kinase